MYEVPLGAGRQDPYAEALEIAVAQVVGGLAGLERADAASVEAKRRQRYSSCAALQPGRNRGPIARSPAETGGKIHSHISMLERRCASSCVDDAHPERKRAAQQRRHMNAGSSQNMRASTVLLGLSSAASSRTLLAELTRSTRSRESWCSEVGAWKWGAILGAGSRRRCMGGSSKRPLARRLRGHMAGSSFAGEWTGAEPLPPVSMRGRR